MGSESIVVFALAIVLVFLVLAAQYESWTNPTAVILVVPLAVLGTVVALLMRDFDNNVYTQIGIVLLIGLASKNAILIVEFAAEQRKQGLSLVASAATAAHYPGAPRGRPLDGQLRTAAEAARPRAIEPRTSRDPATLRRFRATAQWTLAS